MAMKRQALITAAVLALMAAIATAGYQVGAVTRVVETEIGNGLARRLHPQLSAFELMSKAKNLPVAPNPEAF